MQAIALRAPLPELLNSEATHREYARPAQYLQHQQTKRKAAQPHAAR